MCIDVHLQQSTLLQPSCCIPVSAGGAHPTSRALSGTNNALQQQHLTPAQQAAQAAITAPATHRDGKVPVRTGLAWAALGKHSLICKMHLRVSSAS